MWLFPVAIVVNEFDSLEFQEYLSLTILVAACDGRISNKIRRPDIDI